MAADGTNESQMRPLQPLHLFGGRRPVVQASWDHLRSSRYLRGDGRSKALQLPQDWLERGREEEWSFGEQKLVQATSQSKGRASTLMHAAFRTLYLALRLAKLVVQVVHSIIVDAKRALWWQERTARARAEAAAQKRLAEQQRLQAQSRVEEHLKQKQRVVRDEQFSRVLQTMGDPLIPLEEKWPAIAQQCSRKEEFRQQLSRLYQLAEESSKVMQAATSNPAAFWKSEHTMSVIAQEEELKRQFYLQLLHGGAA
ncbi:g4507 [Coccomyxa elongata]